jgi:ComF family protein
MWMISKIISQTFSNCLKLLFPYHCYLCKIETKDTSLCKKCISSFTKAIDTPLPFITSIYSFKDERIKKSIHAVKYFHRKDLIRDFTENGIVNKNIESIEAADNPILIPVPTTLFRKLKRGYCHTEYIALTLGERLDYPISLTTLKRRHFTRAQVGTKRSDRINAQKGSFLIKDMRCIKNKTVILVDDVTTTGATLLEAKRVLLLSGAKNVLAITLAH